MAVNLRDRISFKLARIGVVLAFAIGLVLSCFQLYRDYQEEGDKLSAIITRILTVAEPPASRAVHILDEDLAAEVVNGLLEYEFIKSASVIDDLGIELANRSRVDRQSSTRWITRNISAEFRDFDIPLRTSKQSDVAPGRLHVVVDYDQALSSFFERSLFVLFAGIVRNMVLVLLLFIAFYMMITKPLMQLADSISNIDPEDPSSSKITVHKRNEKDELGQVAAAANQFVDFINRLLDERKKSENALIMARKELELRVEERTRALQHEVNERRFAQEALKEINLHLEQRVEERTKELKAEIVERERTQVALLGAKEAAELANRTKSEFLANMSHELRTPLNAIIGFSSIMKEEMFGELGSQKYREYSGDINQASSHLLQVIGDILDVSKVEVGELTLKDDPIVVAELFNTCIKTIQGQTFSRDLTITSAVPETFPVLLADNLRMRQIIINLLSNAAKFTADGGVVELQASRDKEGGIILMVKDTGIGIPEDQISRVLEPFGQVDNVFSRTHDGVGLGLSLTKSLVELHGGHIAIESELNVGTRVIITMPANRTRDGSDGAAENAEDPLDQNSNDADGIGAVGR